MKFGIYSNLNRDIDGKACIALARFLQDKNIPFVFSTDLLKTDYPCAYLSNDELAKQSDVIVIFGGDGTVLHYAKICAKYNTPIFAVNLGRVGFLTEGDTSKLNESIERIINQDYKVEVRTLLNIKIKDRCFDALNECVISRGAKFSLTDFEYKINNITTEKLRSDAIIIATPTGSTAYSLSCGGSIVSPEVKCILITPVNAYTLDSRPIIVADTSYIEVKIKNDHGVYINIDGEEIFEIEKNDKIFISKSSLNVNFIRFEEGSFYKKLQKKVNILE